MGNKELKLLRVSENKRFLQTEDGQPFFWLGDTAWELFHKLDREEADLYLTNRAQRRFNVIQAVALAESDGIRTGNAYDRKPILKNSNGEYDPTLPDIQASDEKQSYSYWDHVDYIIDKASSLGIYIALLPTWGDKFNIAKGVGPEIFNADNARIYGRWIGERYKDKANIVWVLGGDRILQTARHFSVINEMAEGIKEGDKGNHIMTFHPYGNMASSYHVHDASWLDFNMIQSGHNQFKRDNYNMIIADYEKLPVKPVVDGEPCYEDAAMLFNIKNGFFDDSDARQAAYWATFSGAFGHTYGHGCIWCICSEPGEYFIMNWKDAIKRPGGHQMQFLRNLIESRPFFERIPDQDIIVKNYEDANYMAATRGRDYAFIFSPNGLLFDIHMGKIEGHEVKAHWYNPRNGESTFAGKYINKGIIRFNPPSSGRCDDWVLIIDDASKRSATPPRRT